MGLLSHTSSFDSHSFARVLMLSLWLLLLYIFIKISVQATVEILMAMILLDGIVICWICSECILVFTSITDLTRFWFSRF